MIDWWGVFYNSLWLAGLAVGLTVLSVADYQSHRQGVRLRRKLVEPGYQLLWNSGLALFCLGVFCGPRAWWERVIWGLLAAFFAGQTVWLWRRGQVARMADPLALRAAQSKPRRIRQMGWGLVLTGLLLIGGGSVVAGKQVFDRVRSLQAHVQGLESLARADAGRLGPADLAHAGQHLAGMHQDLEKIRFQLEPLLPVGKWLRWLPRYGGDLEAAPDLLEVAVGLATAGEQVFRALSPALKTWVDSDGGLNPSSLPGNRFLSRLATAQSELRSVQRKLADVRQARARIDAASLSPQTAGLLQKLDRTLSWLEIAVDGAVLAPDLLGNAGPRTYLILAQNNHELRATGGFISGVGELDVEAGRLASLSFSDSYAVDNLALPHDLPPPAFQQTLQGQMWLFRDTNWDADFPTSARRALDVYARDRGVQAEGVVALDLPALQLLVEAIGPIQVAGRTELVSGENVLQVIQAQWAEPFVGMDQEQGQEWWLARKDFMGQVARAILERLLKGQNVQPVKLAQVLQRALQEKHILIYSSDPQAAVLLRERNWDGALPTLDTASDVLLVVDSNVGFNKADANVERSIHYCVDIAANGGLRARLTLTYRNNSVRPVGECIQEARYGDTYADMMDRCYWDYVRVYVPTGSRLLAGPEFGLPAGSLLARNATAMPQSAVSPTLVEGNYVVWSAFFDLAPGEERSLSFEYQLPVELLEHTSEGLNHYRLGVQKQPGTEAVPLQVALTLPPGAELVNALPTDGFALQNTAYVVTTDLRTDREFEIVFQKETGRP